MAQNEEARIGCKLINVQKPDYFRASFTTTESHDMASNALVEKSALVFIGLIHSELRAGRGTNDK